MVYERDHDAAADGRHGVTDFVRETRIDSGVCGRAFFDINFQFECVRRGFKVFDIHVLFE